MPTEIKTPSDEGWYVWNLGGYLELLKLSRAGRNLMVSRIGVRGKRPVEDFGGTFTGPLELASVEQGHHGA